MSIRFAIRNTAGKAIKEGDSFVRFSGTGEPFSRYSERESRAIQVDNNGNPTRWTFVTGLDEEQVQFYDWFNEDEKKLVREYIREMKPVIEKFYGGASVIHPENYSFWKRTQEVNRLRVTHETVDTYYDTKNPSHALLYLSIIGGAFIDLVAPTKEWAEEKHIPHYIVLDTNEGIISDEDEITRSEAHSLLGEIRKEYGREALYILGWCLHYETNAFGAYNDSTSEKDLMTYHIRFIDGKLQSKRKRNCPRQFIDYANKWKSQQTRNLLYTEAYVKAGEYFSFINQREKKYVTSDGTILGNTIEEAVSNLMKPKFRVDYEKLREQVTDKWKGV